MARRQQDLEQRSKISGGGRRENSFLSVTEVAAEQFGVQVLHAAESVHDHQKQQPKSVSQSHPLPAIAQVAPVTTIVNPITKKTENLTPSGLDQVIQQVEEVNAKAAAGDTTVEAVSFVEVINLTILKAVVEIQQDVEVDEEEGFATVAEVEVFVEGDVAVDSEAREDPVIKQILEEAKEEFIENKYNQ